MADEKKDLIRGFEKPEEMEERDIHVSDLLREDEEGGRIAAWFTQLAGLCLRGAGSVTFILDDDQNVRWANPVHVYLDENAVLEETPGRAYRWLRPIVGEGKPQYVAWRNGQLWEIEFLNEYEAEESSSDEDH